jgi:preprotein translocase subunit Sec63
MDALKINYNKLYVLQIINQKIPEEYNQYNRIQEMKIMFEHAIKKSHWDFQHLYTLFMLIYSFNEIKEHFLNYEHQHLKWKQFIDNHLSRLTLEHINFKLNSNEYVTECLNIFFIL